MFQWLGCFGGSPILRNPHLIIAGNRPKIAMAHEGMEHSMDCFKGKSTGNHGFYHQRLEKTLGKNGESDVSKGRWYYDSSFRLKIAKCLQVSDSCWSGWSSSSVSLSVSVAATRDSPARPAWFHSPIWRWINAYSIWRGIHSTYMFQIFNIWCVSIFRIFDITATGENNLHINFPAFLHCKLLTAKPHPRRRPFVAALSPKGAPTEPNCATIVAKTASCCRKKCSKMFHSHYLYSHPKIEKIM